MTTQALREARTYEEALEKTITPEQRPEYHLSTRIGWLNDPNGFSYYNGEYHLFYQYHPYNSLWGPMHWGHAVSQDLLHWKYLPAAMAPDAPFDRKGVFSGSATELPDGRHLLMYTGVIDELDANGGLHMVQQQCIAMGDGREYAKYPGNPVLTWRDLPEGFSKYDFRDPKIWKAKDGTYRAVMGAAVGDRDGRVILCRSDDAFHWEYVKELAVNGDRLGKMWECPDFFPLDDKYVLMFSPMDMLPKGFEYHNGNNTVCLIGTYDEDTEEFVEERDQAVDYGIDFYAPQSLLTPDGRRVMIGWMQNPDTGMRRFPDRVWFGQMTVPRELSIRNGRLYQKPIREIEALRGEKVEYQNVSFSGELDLEGVKGRSVELDLQIRPGDPDDIYHKFSLRFAQDDKFHTSVSLRPKEQVLKVDRKFSDSRRAIIHQRRALVEGSRSGVIHLHVLLDRYSVEIFVNDGEQVMSLTFYTDPSADRISFIADGAVSMDVVKYDLKA